MRRGAAGRTRNVPFHARHALSFGGKHDGPHLGFTFPDVAGDHHTGVVGGLHLVLPSYAEQLAEGTGGKWPAIWGPPAVALVLYAWGGVIAYMSVGLRRRFGSDARAYPTPDLRGLADHHLG